MSRLATLTLVWLGSQSPGGQVKTALDGWAHEQGALLEPARADPEDAPLPTSSLASQCERALDLARDQINGGDDEEARATLRRLEQTLRDHPEMLQASWFLAERFRLEAQLATRAQDGNAGEFRQRAAILEGERALSFGEVAADQDAPLAAISVACVVHGARTHALYWDGRGPSDQIDTLAGEHHLVVLRGARVAWSGWVSVLSSGTLDVWVPPSPSCSSEDFSGVSIAAGDRIVPPNGVRCGAWVAAKEGPQRGTLRIALCSGDQCQPPVTWTYEHFERPSPAGLPPKSSALPTWAAWTLAGLGVVAATSIVLWQSGAFDHGDQPSKLALDPSKL